MSEPRRVLIDWDYGASGIWRCLTHEEMSASAPERGRWSGEAPKETITDRPWSDLLSVRLLDALQAWNRSCESADMASDTTRAVLQGEGRDLAGLVHGELGNKCWEVLYIFQGRVHRVVPPASWPIETWEVDLLGYAPRGKPR